MNKNSQNYEWKRKYDGRYKVDLYLRRERENITLKPWKKFSGKHMLI